MPYFATNEDGSDRERDEELVDWWTRGDVREVLQENLGREVTDKEVDFVLDSFESASDKAGEELRQIIQESRAWFLSGAIT